MYQDTSNPMLDFFLITEYSRKPPWNTPQSEKTVQISQRTAKNSFPKNQLPLMPWTFFMESMEYGGEKGEGERVGGRKKEREEKGGEGGRSTTILSKSPKAARKNHQCVEVLLRAGATIECRTSTGMTPLSSVGKPYNWYMYESCKLACSVHKFFC